MKLSLPSRLVENDGLCICWPGSFAPLNCTLLRRDLVYYCWAWRVLIPFSSSKTFFYSTKLFFFRSYFCFSRTSFCLVLARRLCSNYQFVFIWAWLVFLSSFISSFRYSRLVPRTPSSKSFFLEVVWNVLYIPDFLDYKISLIFKTKLISVTCSFEKSMSFCCWRASLLRWSFSNLRELYNPTRLLLRMFPESISY